jgi:protein-S-isoprenylcysteine O-methyltransferase Ste14/uncharacterized membrane protein (UPF0127 family)
MVVAERLRPAHTHWTRLRGLLGTPPLASGEGLWIRPCRQVHMFGMRYAIDVVFLDDRLDVLHVVSELRPWAVSPKVPSATSVLELPAGTVARLGLRPGTRLAIDGGPPPGAAPAAGRLGPLALNVLLAAFYALFAAAHLRLLRETGAWATVLPILLHEALLVVLFLVRRPSRARSERPRDWLLGVAGTFLPLLMRGRGAPGPLAWLGQPLQVAGLVLGVAAVASLGRSIGIVAANRGVRTAGLYRFVRHPIYGAYVLAYVGYLLSYPRPGNALLVAVTLAVTVARALAEERLLGTDPAYRAYCGRTRWRFVPGVV